MLALQTVSAARRVAGCVALVLTATAVSSAAPRLSLNLNLASSQELSAMSTGALVAEVNAIWWHSNVSLVWRTADVSDPLPAMPESENWLRVLVLARQRSNAGETSTIPPRTANEPCSVTGSSRAKPASTSRSARS